MDGGQVETASADMVHDPAGGPDDHLGPAFQAVELNSIILAAENRHGPEIGHVFSVLLKGFSYLDSKFAGRGENQNLRGDGLPRAQVHEQRKGKSRCFAGASLGLTDDVTALKHMRYHADLDGGGALIAGLIKGPEKVLIESEIGERGCAVIF